MLPATYTGNDRSWVFWGIPMYYKIAREATVICHHCGADQVTAQHTLIMFYLGRRAADSGPRDRERPFPASSRVADATQGFGGRGCSLLLRDQPGLKRDD
ncbi:unnamed protein product [Euphydryas editha]|uniref:Uncharacterized protein n=1 Tax=Euphydryas editha TaxID=104508 RepID=A0AAU9U1M4_EUPED|nr:unnamed protein product [Euphydryas editha]